MDIKLYVNCMPIPITEQTVVGNIHHQWSFPAYKHYKRKRSWFVLVGIALFILIFISMVQGNFLFPPILILFAIIIFVQSGQNSPDIHFSITELGIIVGNRFYEYKELTEFYFFYAPPTVESLYFETSSLTRPRIHVELNGEDPVAVRDTLLEYLEENLEKEEEPLTERFGREWMIH